MSVTVDGTTGVSTPGLDDSGNASIAGNLSVTGAVTQGGAAMSRMVLATAQASTSGTNIDFTGIPSWVKRITVMFNGVSTNGTSVVQIQLGTSGGVEATGYAASLLVVTGANACSITGYSTGFAIPGGLAANTRSGLIIFTTLGSNIWTASGNIVRTDDAVSGTTQGSKTLSGTLDRVRITTVNGTDAFDAGSINIMYEG